MTIIFFGFFLIVLLSCRKADNTSNYLSRDYTNTIKGIFVVFVFLRHFLQYKLAWQDNWIDSIGRQMDAKSGQLLVTMFLFYSGYGVIESFKKKGQDYVKTMPKKRILSTLLNFDIAVIIYIITTVLFLDYKFEFKRALQSLIGWHNYGNSNWYILCILVMYLISYVSLKAFSGNKAIISIFIGTILFTMFMKLFKEPYWYNTAFCYILGCAYSMNKEKLEEWLKNKELLVTLYALILFVLGFNQKGNINWYHIHTIAFAIIILMITRKVNIKNKLLALMGQNLFPLYIFQRIPMLLLKNLDIMKNNPYLFFFISFIALIVITIIYNFTFGKLITLIINKEKTKAIA